MKTTPHELGLTHGSDDPVECADKALVIPASRAKGKRYDFTFYRTVLVDERYEVAAATEEEARALLETDRGKYGGDYEGAYDNPMSLREYLDCSFTASSILEFELDEDATEEIDDED